MSDTTPQRTYDLSKIQSYAGFLQQLFRLQDAKRMTCLPAIVEGFDRASNRATVKPLTQHLVDTLQGELPIDRPSCTVPVLQIGRGGWCIDMPLFVGDTGILIALDRASDGAMANNSTRLWENQDPENKDTILNEGPRPPDNLIYSSFEYGVFIPFAFGGSGLELKKDKDGNDITGIVIKRMIDPNPDPYEEKLKTSDERVLPFEIRLNNIGGEIKQGDKSISLSDNGIDIRKSGTDYNRSLNINDSLTLIECKDILDDGNEKKSSLSISPESIDIQSYGIVSCESKNIHIDKEKAIIKVLKDSGTPKSIEVNDTGISIIDGIFKFRFGNNILEVIDTSTGKIPGEKFNVITQIQHASGGSVKTATREFTKFGNFIVNVGEESKLS